MSARKVAMAGEVALAIVVIAVAGLLSFVSPASPAAVASIPPLAPEISEPSSDGQLLNGADVHMEAQPFADADVRDEHACSDWEIWSAAPEPVERVWAAECVHGASRLHTHLGNGKFTGSLAGAAELPPGRAFEVRARFRSSSADPGTQWSPYSVRPFRTDVQLEPLPGAPQWRTMQDGYVVEEVASGFALPVGIAMAATPPASPDAPRFYVNELYGQIKVVRGDFSVATYAKDLLNFDPTDKFPGDGEMGLGGIVVEPQTGDLFAAMVYKTGSKLYPKVVRLTSSEDGMSATKVTTVLDMKGEDMVASHQISNLTIGPDGKLYVHVADAFEPKTARDKDSFRGKVLRMNLDGSAPADNPFYKAGNGDKARDYVYALGLRNPFGGAWRAADGQHYSVENGPSVDRFARVTRGADFEWYVGDSAMKKKALYNWTVAHAPVGVTFVQEENNQGAGFPKELYGNAYISESGPTYATGPQVRGKRIVMFAFDAKGKVTGPKTLVEYNGNGKSTIAGIAAGTDGLYFSALYPDDAKDGPYAAKAKLYRVRYADAAGAAPKDAKVDKKLCTDDELKITAAPAKTTVARKTSLTIGLKVQNTSKRSCVRDVGADLQELQLLRDGEKLWSSDDCGPVRGSQVVRFAPGQSRAYSATWNGKASNTCEKKGRRVPAGASPAAGTYEIVARVGSDRSEPVTITLK
ncbi:PQQ-dependent sugar dehydrogenase [Catellatospora sp. NPDC049133]|jgi:glucose/arabinose dehydrogenase|uniref:PQQ-dependent sugar dehydrogenase n=1 Tax=Catellatospora sp. NPDC049133 TaxID=3155499 RepID=UPI0033F209AB